MKKLLVLGLLLIFFTGCNKQNIPNTILFEVNLPIDNSIHQEPKITIGVGTGIIMYPKDKIATGEYDYAIYPDSMDRKISKVKGYVYTYRYQDLGLEITTSPLYEPYFYEYTTGLIIKRNGNILYLSGSRNDAPDYIEVFYKTPETSFEDEITSNHLPKGVMIKTGIIENTNGLFSAMQGFHVIYIASDDGNLASDLISFDKQFPQNIFSILFVMDPKTSNKYYKFSVGDCAPGPCSIFGKIRFL